jgi:PKD repeat protein
VADNPPAPPPAKGSTLAGWLKAAIGATAGLLSGAVITYLSPLVDKVVRPSKPVSNFAIDQEGTTVTFHNRSLGGSSGWWDFGDGSALEEVVPGQEVVTHTYPAAGDYTAKLTVRNFLNDEDERTVTLRLDGSKGAPPAITSLEVAPVGPTCCAPATFRLVSKVKNAQVCVWDLDDDRPLEILTENLDVQDRLVTFRKPGGYVIKLVAVNGGQAVEKSEVVSVMEPPAGTITAVLNVTDTATQVRTETTSYTFSETFPPQTKDDVYRFTRQAPARQGFAIKDVRVQTNAGSGPSLGGQPQLALDPKDVTAAGARGLTLQLLQDGRLVQLSGELVKDASTKRGTPPSVKVPVVLTQEKRTSITRPPVPVSATVTVPGSAVVALPPLPADWVDAKRLYRLELQDGERVVWQDSQLPRNKPVTVQKRRCLLTATPAGDQVRIDLVEDRGHPPSAN